MLSLVPNQQCQSIEGLASWKPLARDGAFYGYDYYRTLIGNPMLVTQVVETGDWHRPIVTPSLGLANF